MISRKTRRLFNILVLAVLVVLLIVFWYSVHYKGISLHKLYFPEPDKPQPAPIMASITSYVTSGGSIKVLFCPSEDCLRAYLDIINSADNTLECALYELDHPLLKQAIHNKSSTARVRIVTDNDYYKEFPQTYVVQDKSGLMHNKFCIADGQVLLSGSANPTENDLHKNNNNIIITTSPQLIANYKDEFEELYGGVFKKGKITPNPQVILSGTSIKVSTYFCPEDDCEQKVAQALQRSTSHIECLAFSFTSTTLANILISKHLDNQSIRCVLERRMESKYSQFKRLKYQDIDVHLDGNKNTMHHKVFIVDNQTVITGSFNPTAGGNTRNDENLMIIESEDIARQYAQEFEKIYEIAVSAGDGNS